MTVQYSDIRGNLLLLLSPATHLFPPHLPVVQCTALLSIALLCTAKHIAHCQVCHCTALNWAALQKLHWVALNCIALHCALRIAHCTLRIAHCAALNCTALHLGMQWICVRQVEQRVVQCMRWAAQCGDICINTDQSVHAETKLCYTAQISQHWWEGGSLGSQWNTWGCHHNAIRITSTYQQ